MREIKFRVWNPNANKFVAYAGVNEMPLHEAGALTLKVPVYEILQYTGLKDRNGVEIYEGDVIRADEDIINFHTQLIPENSYEVRFWDGCWCLFSTDGMNIDLLNVGEAHSEVIGNIYENPELLEANQ